MGWTIGFDPNWQRDIGYGVPAYCDFPGCGAMIDRGLAYVCGGEPYGGDEGCGLYFCGKHLRAYPQLCERCAEGNHRPFDPTPDHPDWIQHKLTDPSWAEWRAEHPEFAASVERAGKGPGTSFDCDTRAQGADPTPLSSPPGSTP